MEKIWKKRIGEHLDVIGALLEDGECREGVVTLAELAVDTLGGGGKIFLCGNGGSAADAQHLAAEFVGRFVKERPALNAMALTVNTSSLTAIGNDYGYDQVFSRQVEAFGSKGDLLIGLSTSGNSQNVVKAMVKAKEIGIGVACFIGENKSSKMAGEADICISVPSKVTARIQEAHILIGHMVCEYVEEALYSG